MEVRERNDIINSLQVQVDILKEEAQLYGLPSSDELSSMKTANLVTLLISASSSDFELLSLLLAFLVIRLQYVVPCLYCATVP